MRISKKFLSSVGLVVFLLFAGSAQAAPYRHRIISVAGTGSGTAFTDFDNRVSQNDLGQVVFSARTVAGSFGNRGIWRGDGTGAITELSTGFNSANRQLRFPVINNNGMVVAGEQVSGSPPAYLIRQWAPSSQILDRSDTSPSYSAFVMKALNNNGAAGQFWRAWENSRQ